MPRFKRLTAAEARELPRSALLDRIQAEQTYWERKYSRGMTDEDRVAEREFHRILYASLDPGAGVADARAYLEGVPGAGSYFDEKPDVPDLEEAR